MSELILVGDEAWTAEEWAKRERKRQVDRDYHRRRYANDPEFRARHRAYVDAWKARNVERVRKYHRERMRRRRAALGRVQVASLHSLACTGPTKATGCRCRKVMLYERAA